MNKTNIIPTTMSTPTTNSQFKHTILWNNIINDLKKNLETTTIRSSRSSSCSSTSTSNLMRPATANVPSSGHTRIRRQHSRFISAGVNGMLMLRQNLMNANSGNSIENVCFTGSKCVDIVYDYLTNREQTHNFERQITREKVAKLCQTLMDSGVFESTSKSTKFDDTILKTYRFKQPKQDTSPKEKKEKSLEKSQTLKQKVQNNTDDEVFVDEQAESNKENNYNNQASATVGFNKNDTAAKLIPKSIKPTSANTKLKRKLISMKRSSTVQTLMPVEVFHKDSNTTEDKKKIDKEFLTRQIKRELIVEKLLNLIDLPLIENLLLIDQPNEAQETNSAKEVSHSINAARSKSTSSLETASLSILNQTYDLTRCDSKEEWRKSAIDCLQYLEWEKVWHQMQLEKDSVDSHLATSSSKTNSKYSIVNALYNPLTPHKPFTKLQSLLPRLQTLSDMDLYNLIREYYKNSYSANREHFLDDSFQPLFQQILLFLRQTHYNKALEALNLGTLLLMEKTQAEFKRLLKFLYLTANTSTSPRLCDKKPNNSVLLNHFAECLFNTKLIGYEESRLILNFMLNNFDDLFKLNKSIEESLNRRFSLMRKHGHEEALLEKLYCKKMTNKEVNEKSREETTKALVDLINHLIDDPQISLKQKKLKLRALQRIHPEIYAKHFSDLQY